MPRTPAVPYSVSYLFPAPPKVPGHRGNLTFDPGYVDRVKHVFEGLHSLRARAGFFAVHYQIVGAHPELEGLLYNAPPHWDDKTMTATEVDGTVIEKYADPNSASE